MAQRPYPGTVAPTALAFTPDGAALSYLLPEAPGSLSRVLWRLDNPGQPPRIVARPPADADANEPLSREEALRRERQRQLATGISQVSRAAKADVTIIPLKGDVYLQRGDGPLDRLTETEAPELDPRPSPDGSKIAYVRNGELHVMDVASREETQLSTGAEADLTHGLAEFIAQEELDRQVGYWWSPDGTKLAYQETDERHIPLYTIPHAGDEEFSVETHRYPFAGAENARVRLGVVSAAGGETRWLSLFEPGEEGYLARVDWQDPDTLFVQLLSRDQKRLRMVRINIQSDEKQTLIDDTAATWLDLHDDLRLLPETGEFIWSSASDGVRRLELRDKAGKLVRNLTPPEIPVDGMVHLDPKRREAWFLGAGEGPLQQHLYRVGLDAGQPARLTLQPGFHTAVVAPDGSRYVDTFSNIQKPPVTVLYDRNGNQLAIPHDAAGDPRLAELILVAPQLIAFPNRDGVTLHGAYYAPRSDALGKPAPLIVMVYGGPTVQTVTRSWGMTADLTAQLYASLGFAVWKCDNQGSEPARSGVSGSRLSQPGNDRGSGPGRRRPGTGPPLSRPGRRDAGRHHRRKLRRIHDPACPDPRP